METHTHTSQTHVPFSVTLCGAALSPAAISMATAQNDECATANSEAAHRLFSGASASLSNTKSGISQTQAGGQVGRKAAAKAAGLRAIGHKAAWGQWFPSHVCSLVARRNSAAKINNQWAPNYTAKSINSPRTLRMTTASISHRSFLIRFTSRSFDPVCRWGTTPLPSPVQRHTNTRHMKSKLPGLMQPGKTSE